MSGAPDPPLAPVAYAAKVPVGKCWSFSLQLTARFQQHVLHACHGCWVPLSVGWKACGQLVPLTLLWPLWLMQLKSQKGCG